ncbi:hypothetical protein MTO96_039086 [Rhipicephalus appendiculatus]
MPLFRRDILFLVGVIFVVCILAQIPTSVLAGQKAGKLVTNQHLAITPRSTARPNIPPIRANPPPRPHRRPPPVQVRWRPPSPPVRRDQRRPHRGHGAH